MRSASTDPLAGTRPRLSAAALRAAGAILAVALLAAALVVLTRGPEQRHLTAYFTRAVGLYPGADVRILGISVGKVTKVTPVGDAVKVELEYDAKYKVPADAQAMLVNQTVVADRFIQLAPVYKGGPVMPDGYTLAVSRTQVPVEVDEIGKGLNDLSTALGPEGANQNGALSRLLQVGANTLQGQGTDIRQTIDDTSRMLSTLSADREDVATTIRNLRIITATLRANDQQIRQFNGRLNGVSGQLAAEKEELSAALNTLAPTLRAVQRFVKENRGRLAVDVRQLAQLTGILVKEKDAFAELLVQGPLAVTNLARAYDPISGTIHSRADLRQFHDLADWICSLAHSVGAPPQQCLNFLQPVNGIGKVLTSLTLDLSWITALTTHYDPEPIPPDAYGPKGRGGGQDRPSQPQAQQGGARDIRALLPGGGGR
ncbi:ABC transporter substrate-binding protein [Actinomadura sp. NBRC 104412]|uniref:MCE family protein n=1 Tax=Actinomadura sp. NBRC 104412 TaxID=3032203 RepID=UPI0024A45E79|nr:MCE family protein [Actinomadura sp. NBRC 104412]GLZ07598.1 ABC transporter substrate-binding protein [Actinomadura sp. NBRC 104412]